MAVTHVAAIAIGWATREYMGQRTIANMSSSNEHNEQQQRQRRQQQQQNDGRFNYSKNQQEQQQQQQQEKKRLAAQTARTAQIKMAHKDVCVCVLFALFIFGIIYSFHESISKEASLTPRVLKKLQRSDHGLNAGYG